MSKSNISKKKMEKDFAIYLNDEGILKDIEFTVIQYEKTVCELLAIENFPPPLRIQFKLDLIKIKNISGKLHRLFVKEPIAGMNLIKDVIFCVVLLVLSAVTLDKTDLHVIPLVFNLPITKEIPHLFLRPSYALESIRGMLINITTPGKYVRSAFFCCENKSCPKNKWQRYSENIWNICPDCYGSMKEHIPSTDTGEEIIGQFVSLKAYQSTGRFQALQVKIRDELINIDLTIGEEYIITGRLKEKMFEVMNVQPTAFELQNYSIIPASIANLHFEISETQKNCPWSFVIALSSLLGSSVIPISSFLNLKMGLMLSLATVQNNCPVPLVAIGSDLLNAQNLFQAAGKFAERYIKFSTAHSFLGGIVKPGPQTDVVCQEAGLIILATKGVCNLGDWSKFKKEQANYICQTIESGQVLLNKAEVEKTNVINFVPLKCAVWTYWCNYKTSRNNLLQLKTLINVFGMPFLAEEKNVIEQNKICWKNLNMAVKNFTEMECQIQISSEDFKEFFKIINSREVVLSESASQLIRNYFVVSRRDRSQRLPLGAIKTITSLAEAHARIALRSEVLFEDVAAIIYLYEEVMSSLYGESLIPYPKVPWNEEPIYVWMSKQLQKFSLWLEEYTSI